MDISVAKIIKWTISIAIVIFGSMFQDSIKTEDLYIYGYAVGVFAMGIFSLKV